MKKVLSIIVTLSLVATLLLAGCSQGTGDNSKKAAGLVKKISVALLPDESPATVIKNNKELKEYLSKTLNMEVELVVTTDYSSMIEGMRKGHIDIGYFGPLSYVLLKQKMANVEPFAVKLEKGEPTYKAVVIANADSGIKSLTDIKGHTVVFGDTASTSSHMIPKEMIASQGGLKAGQDYKEQFVGSHDAVAMAVQNGNAQAGGLSKPILDSLLEKGIIKKDKVIEIALSKPYPNYPWAIRTDLDKDLQEKIKKAFYDLKDAEVLKPLKADGFAPITDKDYDVIREMVGILGINLEEMQ